MLKKVLFFTLLALVFSLSLYAQGSPKQIVQELYDLGGFYPDNVVYPEEGTIQFKIWITARPQYVINAPNPAYGAGAKFDQLGRFILSFNIGNFASVGSPQDWSVGEILHLEVEQTTTGRIAVVEFALEPGASQIRYGRDGKAIALKNPPTIIFDSRPTKNDTIETSARMVSGYPLEGVYRADNWEKNAYWEISFSTIGYSSELEMTSELRRQYNDDDEVYGPRVFRTYYSTNNGDSWVQYPVTNYLLPMDEANWFKISFELPSNLYNKEKVLLRWELFNTQGLDGGWGEIRNVVITGYATYALTIEMEGEGATEPAMGTYIYTEGESVKIKAIANVDGWIFDKWIIERDGIEEAFYEPQITLVMEDDILATAIFSKCPNPNPTYAISPQPPNEATLVPTNSKLGWAYEHDSDYADPVGYFLVISKNNDLSHSSTRYIEGGSGTYLVELDDDLEPMTNYYWQVIPVSEDGFESLENSIWTFQTGKDHKPANAVNPIPEDNEQDVSIDIATLEWSFYSDPFHVNPVGFKVYFGIESSFYDDDYTWVDYVDEQVEYSMAVDTHLELETKYYWKVVPTTDVPLSASRRSVPKFGRIINTKEARVTREDALDSPVWCFTTEKRVRIEVSSESLSYGKVEPNVTVTKPLVISRNNSREDLEIFAITSNNQRFKVILPEGVSYPITMARDDSLMVDITFTPMANQIYSGNIVIVSNDYESGITVILLSGEGYPFVASFTSDVTSGDAPLEVQFTNQSQGEIVSYFWDFGDGNTSSEINPKHTYLTRGLFTVSLTIRNQYGATKTVVKEDYIFVDTYPLISIPKEHESLDYGEIYLGNIELKSILIQSVGTDTLYINQIYIEQESDVFSVYSEDIPEFLLPSEEYELKIGYAPPAEMDYNGIVHILNNSRNDGSISVSLSGSATYAPPKQPLDISIHFDGHDAVIEWDEVTEAINGYQMNATYYFVYGACVVNPSDTEQLFLGYSTTTSFRHLGVTLPGLHKKPPLQYFYQVTAVYWPYSTRSGEDDFSSLIGKSRKEVREYLQRRGSRLTYPQLRR